MELENYNLGLDLKERVDVQNRAEKVGGICGTISAIEILNHFNIKLSDIEIKEGIKDHHLDGTNQVNMALFMSQHLDVTFCVNYDIKREIEKGEEARKILYPVARIEFPKLLSAEIKFEISPSLPKLIRILNEEDALAQFVFLEDNADMTHCGLLCKVENNLMEFSQREHQTWNPDVKPEDLMKWWDLQGKSKLDPEQLLMIYRRKGDNKT